MMFAVRTIAQQCATHYGMTTLDIASMKCLEGIEGIIQRKHGFFYMFSQYLQFQGGYCNDKYTFPEFVLAVNHNSPHHISQQRRRGPHIAKPPKQLPGRNAPNIHKGGPWQTGPSATWPELFIAQEAREKMIWQHYPNIQD